MDFIRNSLHAAIVENNQGVRLLMQNEDQLAVASLTKALNLVKGLLSGPPTQPLQEEDQAPQNGDVDELNTFAIIDHNFLPLPHLQDSNCFIYDNALPFAPIASVAPGTLRDEFMHIYSAVIIFNLALAYHRRGKNTQNKFCLQKAERMYEMLTNLLAGQVDNAGTGLLIKLASINNLSQLRFDQGRYTQSLQGFHQVAAIIQMTPSEDIQVFQEHEYQGLLLNVLTISTPKIAAAA